jgi:flagellar motor protein MotB
MKTWTAFVVVGSLAVMGCADEQARLYPNDSMTRVLYEMKRPTGAVKPAAVAADDRDARLAALEKERADLLARLTAAQDAAARLEARPPQVIEKVVEKRVEVPVPVPVEKVVEKVVEKIVRVPLIELRADALFDSGKAELRPNAALALKNAADALKKFRDNIRTVHVDGHADNRPISTREFPNNQALSEARAQAVAAYLLKHSGLPADKVIATGYGDSKPIADNSTAEGQAQNRRVEVTVDQVDGR